MRITASELNNLKTLVYSQRSINLLGSFPEREALLQRLKTAKKQWWRQLRSNYGLPSNTKFAIELDGEAAGEIRIKGSGGRAYVPDNNSFVTNNYTPPQPRSACGVDRNELLASMNAVFRDLGIEVVARQN